MLKANIKIYQLAKKLNITRPSLSRKLRYKLTDTEKRRILKAINQLKEQN